MKIKNLITQMKNNKKIEIFGRTNSYILCRSREANKKCQIVKIPLQITPQMSFLAGIIVGDGHLNKSRKRGPKIEIEMANEKIMIYLKKLFFQVFNIKVIMREIIDKQKRRKNRWKIQVCNKPICMLFNKVFQIPFGKKAKKVVIPNCVKKDINLLRMFCSGLFLADSGRKGKRIAFTTTSRKLFNDVKNCLRVFGISFFSRKWKHPKGTIVFDIIISKKSAIAKFFNTFPELKIKFAGVR